MNKALQLPAGLAYSRRVLGGKPAVPHDADEFVVIIAHELRNPLGPLKNVAAFLKYTELDIPAVRRASEIIDRQVRAMSALIDDLLNTPRQPVGKFRLWRTLTTVSEILDRALETACPVVVERGHKLVVSKPLEEITLEADAMRLSQVLHNLIVNAAKYTNPGGQIQIDVRHDANDVMLIVSDTGIGIAFTQIEAIFDLYTQIATERSAGGSGIGLYVARSLVEAHGGTLRAVSQGSGQGSKFIVRLPCNSVVVRSPIDQDAFMDAEQLRAWEDEGGSGFGRASTLEVPGNLS